MDEPEFDLRQMFPAHPHIGLIAEFFECHIVLKEKDVVSKSATEFCQRLERLIARVEDQGTFLPLFSFISSHSTTDISHAGRKFTAVVMNPRPSARIALSVRGTASRPNAMFKLTLDKQERSLPLPDGPDTWNTFEGFNLTSPLPEGPILLKVEPSEGLVTGILVWTA